MNRLLPLKKLIEALKSRGYNNIVVIDNMSTYKPLLDWYKEENINVYSCQSNYGHKALECCRTNEDQFKEKYLQIIENEYFVYTDSDVVPVDEIPNDFIEDMIDMSKTYNISKLGLSLKVDDIPDHFSLKKEVIDHENRFFTSGYIEDKRCQIFKAAVDTTFAIHVPGFPSTHSKNAYRTGGNYFARHMPWYYDTNNLPEDEKYYSDNIIRSTYWTVKIKNKLGLSL